MVSTGKGAADAARARLGLLTLIVLLIATIFPTPAVAASDCHFGFGFKTLHDLIPSIVGDCQSNESYGSNGDSLQLTRGGLLVWRKADNHTAFTNGSTTWVLGPFGLQTRPNNARFAWEPDIAPPNVDPRLSASYQVATSSRFRDLITDTVAKGTSIQATALRNAWGAFVLQRGGSVISINESLLDADPNDAAAVLIHEATHANDLATRPGLDTPAGCIQTEVRARRNEIAFWLDQYGPQGKQPPANRYEAQQNYLLSIAASSLQALVAETLVNYQQECGLAHRAT